MYHLSSCDATRDYIVVIEKQKNIGRGVDAYVDVFASEALTSSASIPATRGCSFAFAVV